MEDAIGLSANDTFAKRDRILEERFPILKMEVEHPTTRRVQPLSLVIAGLNNSGGDYDLPLYLGVTPWTRERIADWVESVERSLEPRQAAVASTEPAPVIAAQLTEESRLQLA